MSEASFSFRCAASVSSITVAVYHFTFHAWGTWDADHPRGYTVRGEGYQAPDPREQRRRDENALQDVIEFDGGMQKLLIAGMHDICERRGWTFHGCATDPTHFHPLISWREFVEWQDARDKLKNILSLFLGRWTGIEGRTWFVDGGSRKRVVERGHYDYLLETYFPDHRRGIFWKEGMVLPYVPRWVFEGKGKPPGASASGHEI